MITRGLPRRADVDGRAALIGMRSIVHWPVEILPWYQCYTEEERHSGHGSIVVHDGLLPPVGDERAVPATFENLYPPEIRERVLAAQSATPPKSAH